MENEIKKIFLTYKVLSEIKQKHNSNFVNEASWSEAKSGMISNLDDEFEKIVNEFKRQMSKYGCYSTFTSGLDTTRKNPTSLHKVGKAIDVRTYDHASPPVPPYLTQDCVNKAYKVCEGLSKTYPGLKCVHEKTRSQSSQDFTAPHFHIEYSQGSTSGSTQPNKSGYYDEYTMKMLSGTMDKIVKPVVKQLVNPLLAKVGAVNEDFNFGPDSQINSSGDIIIKANSGNIKSPISGKVEKPYSFTCKNQIIITPEEDNYKIRFCNISNPAILPNEIHKGFNLGSSANDVRISLLTKLSSKIKWNTDSADELINPKTKYSREKDKKYYDNFIPDLVNFAMKPFKDESGNFDFVSPTSGKLPKKWKSLTEEKERLVKDLQRIKELLK